MEIRYLLVLCFLVALLSSIGNVYAAHQSVVAYPKAENQTVKVEQKHKLWKVEKRRKNPAPIFLVIMIIAALAALAAYFLNMGVLIAGILGGIAFIAFILYFVYSGAN
ncbi:MAG: hypothetical protein NZ519_10595 [Bacteroidia bacterium]|nr:hypothetical protein [Bacteroidia bacterium]MDW8302118.1 hypothetical protein [Bacteroidia bacterium]